MNIGETLAQARQEAGLTVTQVSERTRIRETVIRAVECNDFTICGGNFYARGHIRSIARVVGIDADPLVRAYDDAHGGAPQAISAATAFEPETPVRFRERRSPNWTAAMAVVFAVVMVWVVLRVIGGSGGDSKTVQPQAASERKGPVSAAPATPGPATATPAAPRAAVTVLLKATGNSWVNVRDGHGKQIFSGLVRTGDAKQFSDKNKLRVLIGNGGGVTLNVNGRDLGTPGQDGQVLRLTFGPGDPVSA